MSNRSEYQKQYQLKNKEKLAEKRRQKNKALQLQSLKDELKKTETENVWFDPNRNPYLQRLCSEENRKYENEKQKRFNLQYNIDHFFERKKGDYEKYVRQRMKDYSKFCLEQDVKFQIIRWRMFRKACLEKLKREPDFTDMMYNSVCKPPEICEDGEFYRSDLLYLLESKPEDEEFKLVKFDDDEE